MIKVRLPAGQANGIQATLLKETPFFLKGNETVLFDKILGSNYAFQHKERLLADAIPARTLAAGKKEVQAFKDLKIDLNMQSKFKTDKAGVIYWPSSRNPMNWRHSDLREVAYSYIFLIFNEFAKSGGLK